MRTGSGRPSSPLPLPCATPCRLLEVARSGSRICCDVCARYRAQDRTDNVTPAAGGRVSRARTGPKGSGVAADGRARSGQDSQPGRPQRASGCGSRLRICGAQGVGHQSAPRVEDATSPLSVSVPSRPRKRDEALRPHSAIDGPPYSGAAVSENALPASTSWPAGPRLSWRASSSSPSSVAASNRDVYSGLRGAACSSSISASAAMLTRADLSSREGDTRCIRWTMHWISHYDYVWGAPNAVGFDRAVNEFGIWTHTESTLAA